MSSIPARVTAADQKDLNPVIARTCRLIARWSCSTTLLRVLVLSELNFCAVGRVVALDRRGVGATLVDGNLPRLAMLADRLAQEAQGCLAIPLRRQQEIDSLPCLCRLPDTGTSTDP